MKAIPAPRGFARPRIGIAAMVALAFVALVVGSLMLNRSEANAASASVTVGSPTDRFTPNVSSIAVGDTVTFTWASGTHDVDFMDVTPDLNIDSTHTTGTTSPFTTPGTYYYYCSIHATEDQATEAHVQARDAMVGKIVVSGTAPSPAPAAGAPPAAGSTSQAQTADTPALGAPSTGNGAPSPATNGDRAAFALLAIAAVLSVLTTAAVVASVRRR